MVSRGVMGGEWVKEVMGIKEGTCDKQQVMYQTAESLNCTPESNLTMYGRKIFKKILVCVHTHTHTHTRWSSTQP